MILAVWDVTLYTIVGSYHRFRYVLCIHLEGNLPVKILTSQKTRIKIVSLFFSEYVQRKLNNAIGHVEFPLGIILVMGTF